jgi:hypothetical protein
LYKPNPKIAVLNFLTLKAKPASSSIIKEEEKEREDVQSNEDKKDEKEEELQSNAEEKEEEELQSNDEEEEEGELQSNEEEEEEEEIQSNEVQRTSAFVCLPEVFPHVNLLNDPRSRVQYPVGICN